MILQSIDGHAVHISMLDGSAICIHEAREVPEKFVQAAFKTGRVGQVAPVASLSKESRKRAEPAHDKSESEA